MSEYLTCIIVDDEPPAIRLLQKYTEQLQGITCVATCTRAVEALQLIEQHKPDVVFLDIQMPDLTGIQLSAIIKDKVKIVFTTAYPQFAVEGFEVNAVDYLLKPIPFNRFIVSVEKVRAQTQSATTAASPTAELFADEYFFIKTDGKNRYQRIELNDIWYIESIRNYIVLHTTTGQVVTYNTLKYFEENLPASFIKIHKSYIVAIGKIEKTDSSEVWVAGKSLPLGDTYKTDFFRKIESYKL